MKQFGKVDIPQNAFLNALKMHDNQNFFLFYYRYFDNFQAIETLKSLNILLGASA